MAEDREDRLPTAEERKQASDEAAEAVRREYEEREGDPNAPNRPVDPDKGPGPDQV